MTGIKNRIVTLDWLRGLMALSIMFYHLTFWTISPVDISNPLGRLGIYGVSVFFILSGLSMGIVYSKYIKNYRTTIYFYIRRIFRIWPLFGIVCFLTILPQFIKTGTYNWKVIIANITTVFGFIKPNAYIPTGGWSIGNEVVYYALTPLILFFYNLKRLLGNIILFISLVICLLFAFIILKPNVGLDDQWPTYINPLNNLFLYILGIAIYYNFKDIVFEKRANSILLLVAILFFCFLPFGNNPIQIVTGAGRVVFISLSGIIVLCFYKLTVRLPNWLSLLLEQFGTATYGVYLFHPIVYLYLGRLLMIAFPNNLVLFFIVPIITVFISLISYRYFELKLIKVGKRLTINQRIMIPHVSS